MNNQDEEQSNSLGNRLKNFGAKKVKKAAGNVAKKAGKEVLKKALTIIISAFKKLLVYLIGLLAPYIGAIIAILLILMFVYLIVAMLFSFGKTEITDENGKELIAYIEKQVDESVDSSKPEQAPFKVPADLVIATMQIHNSSEFGKEEKEIVKDVVKALTPTFTYEEKSVTTKIKTYTCVQVGDGKSHCNNAISEKVEKVKVLSKVDSWDRKVAFTYTKVNTGWSDTGAKNSVTGEGKNKTETTEGTAESVDSFESEEKMTPDYTYFDVSLRKEPLGYGDKDIKMVEILYLATGGEILYSEWLKGEDIQLSSYPIGYGDVDVEPGAGVPVEFMPYYLSAQKKYGVPWYYLASMHYQETRFGTNTATSSAGAIGPMQFMRCTWIGWSYPGCKYASDDELKNSALVKKYGGYGRDANGDGKTDPFDTEDAMHSAANLLIANKFNESNASAVADALALYAGSAAAKAYWYSDEVTQRALQYKEEANYISSGSNAPGVVGAPGVAMMPILAKYVITSTFAPRFYDEETEFHHAMDFAAPGGTPIYSITDATVIKTESGCSFGCGGWGNYVWTKQQINGKTYEVIYAHMTKVMARTGAVKKGQVIGTVGTTGDSTGNHLHIEMHLGSRVKYVNAVDPALFLPLK